MKMVQVLFLSDLDVYRFQIADPVSDHAAANVFMTTFGEHSLLTSRRVHYRQFLITLVFVCRWKNHGKATHIGPIPISSSAIKSIRGNENERIGSSVSDISKRRI